MTPAPAVEFGCPHGADKVVRAPIVLLCLLLALSAATASAAEVLSPLPKGVSISIYRGWLGSVTLTAEDVEAKAIVVPAVGGRIVHYSLEGQNILWEPDGVEGKTLETSVGDLGAGGHQCDLGPEIRGIPRHSLLWAGQYRSATPRNYSAGVTSTPDPAVGIQMSREVILDPETGDLGITQRMKNVSDQETSFCLWDRTLVKSGGFAFFPLNKKSRFPAKWSLRQKVEGKYSYDGALPASPQVKVLRDVLVVQCEGPATKVGADSDAGWIAYVRGRLLFVKYFPYSRHGEYSDGGNSVEVYFDEKLGEVEPLSPEIKLKPGEDYVFPEKWILIELDKSVHTHEEARALVKRIPPSPFRP